MSQLKPIYECLLHAKSINIAEDRIWSALRCFRENMTTYGLVWIDFSILSQSIFNGRYLYYLDHLSPVGIYTTLAQDSFNI